MSATVANSSVVATSTDAEFDWIMYVIAPLTIVASLMFICACSACVIVIRNKTVVVPRAALVPNPSQKFTTVVNTGVFTPRGRTSPIQLRDFLRLEQYRDRGGRIREGHVRQQHLRPSFLEPIPKVRADDPRDPNDQI